MGHWPNRNSRWCCGSPLKLNHLFLVQPTLFENYFLCKNRQTPAKNTLAGVITDKWSITSNIIPLALDPVINILVRYDNLDKVRWMTDQRMYSKNVATTEAHSIYLDVQKCSIQQNFRFMLKKSPKMSSGCNDGVIGPIDKQ